ncbi:MAG: hypothetical protein ACFFCB_00630 [Candidatus Odinarchaeota archaeon]
MLEFSSFRFLKKNVAGRAAEGGGMFLEGEDDSGLRPPWEDSAYEEFEVSGFFKIVLLPHTGF